jgi:hypothetical protein
MKLRYLVLAGALVASAVGLMSCGSTFSCTSKGPCANDPTPTQADTDACNKLLNGKCGTQFKAAGQCGLDHSMCGSDGKSTTSASCTTESNDFSTCLTACLTDGGC